MDRAIELKMTKSAAKQDLSELELLMKLASELRQMKEKVTAISTSPHRLGWQADMPGSIKQPLGLNTKRAVHRGVTGHDKPVYVAHAVN